MTQNIELSVIIPTFRREKELVNAIRSVLEIQALNIEVLVGDDSPEGGAQSYVEAINDPRVHYTKRENPTGGVPALVRNDLARIAKGEVFYFLDDDDTVDPAVLVEVCLNLVSAPAGVAIAAVNPVGDADSPVVVHEKKHYAFARRKFQSYVSKYQYLSRLLNSMPLMVCSAGLVTREAFEKAGGFDPEIPLFEDIEFYVRAIRESGYIYCDKILLNRKTGGDSLVQNETDNSRIQTSYKMMSDSYRQRYGSGEWMVLKLMNRLRMV